MNHSLLNQSKKFLIKKKKKCKNSFTSCHCLIIYSLSTSAHLLHVSFFSFTFCQLLIYKFSSPSSITLCQHPHFVTCQLPFIFSLCNSSLNWKKTVVMWILQNITKCWVLGELKRKTIYTCRIIDLPFQSVRGISRPSQCWDRCWDNHIQTRCYGLHHMDLFLQKTCHEPKVSGPQTHDVNCLLFPHTGLLMLGPFGHS